MRSLSRLSSVAFFLAVAVTVLAYISFFSHSLGINRQPDPQLTTTAFQFLQSLANGTIGEFLLTVRKYPLLPSVLLCIAYVPMIGFLFLSGKTENIDALRTYLLSSPVEVQFAGRVFMLLLTALTFFTLIKISRRLFPDVSPNGAVLLLCSSILFLLLSSAVRPHMFVALLALVTLLASVRLYDHPSRKNELFAFGAALLAFLCLQNGLFALIFPLGAMLLQSRRDRKHLPYVRLLVFFVIFVFLASLIGYPFVWNAALGNGVSWTFDLGHDFHAGEAKWTGGGFVMFGITLLGTESFLLISSLLGIATLRRTPHHPMVHVVLFFLAIYFLIFGLYASESRYLFVCLPLLALLGGPFLAKRPIMMIVISTVVIVMQLQFSLLAFRADTYDRASTEVQGHQGVIATDVPWYYLGIPPTRASLTEPEGAYEMHLASLPDDLPDARDFVSTDDISNAMLVLAPPSATPELSGDWEQCGSFIAIENDNGDAFLWRETPWALWKMWKAERLGPNLDLYCRQ